MTTNNPANKNTLKARRFAQQIEAARQFLGRTTLDDQKSSSDFFEVSAWEIRDLVKAAFEAGFAAATEFK